MFIKGQEDWLVYPLISCSKTTSSCWSCTLNFIQFISKMLLVEYLNQIDIHKTLFPLEEFNLTLPESHFIVDFNEI